jgi:8-oxo-dGDP phosphatase
MSLPGSDLPADGLHDVRLAWPSRRVDEVRGRLMRFVTDEVTTPDGHTMVREYLEHTGAVAIIALDDAQRVAVVTQYRHPVGWLEVEPPAGLLDVEKEDPLTAAQRELAEEAELGAKDWRVLVDMFSSPGGSSESIRIYLARDLVQVGRPDGFVAGDEEAHMNLHWAALDEIINRIYEGAVHNPSLIVGALSLAAAIHEGRLDQLRPGDAPWSARAVRTDKG